MKQYEKPTNLAVENLEPSDAVNHAFQLDSLDVLIFAVHSLHPEDVVAEVQALKPDMYIGQEKGHVFMIEVCGRCEERNRFKMITNRNQLNLPCCPSITVMIDKQMPPNKRKIKEYKNLLCCPSNTIMTAPAQLSPSPNSCSTVNSFSPTESAFS